jgi:hypothetical protein
MPAFTENVKNMDRENVKNLVREYLALRKKTENLQEELSGLGDRFEKFGALALSKKTEHRVQKELGDVKRRFERTGNLLYGRRSKSFIGSVLSCVVDLEGEYEKEEHYYDFLANLVSILTHFDQYDADRRKYTSQDLLRSYDEEKEFSGLKLSARQA